MSVMDAEFVLCIPPASVWGRAVQGVGVLCNYGVFYSFLGICILEDVLSVGTRTFLLH